MAQSPTKQDIRALTLEALQTTFQSLGEKPFRAKQVMQWLWQKGAHSFDDMSNLSLNTRAYLSDHFTINALTTHTKQQSKDGTIKFGFQLYDKHLIEGVLIPTEDRQTACVSSQVGCSLSCKFCATGFLERKRNLTPGEIFDQVVLINQAALEHHQKPLSNIVFMGMGEPLLNYKHLLEGIEHITSPDGLGMSPRRITVSTAGIAKMILRLAEDQVRFNLALSLHAANDAKRDKIMPINEQNNINALIDALNTFYQATKNKVTFEYILFKDFNDALEDARELVALCRKVPTMVNLIEYNVVDQVNFSKPSQAKVDAFAQYLERHGITAKIRRSRGKDIDAACGQLANKH